ncbi:MAG: Gfo/Idh/MocA family oxidoreductase [Nakamurella sp.]
MGARHRPDRRRLPHLWPKELGLTTPRVTPRPPPRSSQGISVGVVGAGAMARTHLAVWQRLGVPARVFSPSGRASAFAGTYAATTSRTLDALIDSCTVVDICSPTGTHLGVTEQASAAGRHVICEKPLALTHADAAAIIAVTAAAGVQLHVAHVVRYFAGYAQIRDMVLAGDIGVATIMQLRRTGAAPDADWFHDDERSGGVLMDQMIHDFDYARWVFGEVTVVSAHTEKAATGGDPRVVRATASLTHVSGATSHLTGGWLEPDAAFTTSVSVQGSAGELRHTNSYNAIVVTGTGATGAAGTRRVEFGEDCPYDTQLADFAAAINGGPAPRINPADALAAVDLTLAARKSVATGKPISVA